MTLQAGQLFIPGSAEEIRDDLLADFRLEAVKYSVIAPAVTPGTDNWFFFTAVANAGLLQYSNIATIRPAITPLNATGEDLEEYRIALGLPVVQASPAAGKLTVTVSGVGSVTFSDGLQFLYPSGLRGKVSGTQLNVFDEQDVNVVAIDTGGGTNLESGMAVRWVNPPFNVATQARVSINGPLTGGFDSETEDRKRDRVLNRFQNTPGGGNWGQLREIAFNTLPSVKDAYVYPALGGSSSDKLTILKGFDRARNDYHRSFQLGAIALVRDAIHSQLSTGDEHVVGTGDELACDVTLLLELPSSALAGGNGLGWLDQYPWPPNGSGTPVTVSATSGALNVTVHATTVVSPLPGQTHIMWWSRYDMKMRTSLVTTVDPSSTSGSWILTVDAPFVDSLGNVVAVGDFISPAATNAEKYGGTFIDLMESLGAGENTFDAQRLPRSARHPFVGDGADLSITNKFLTDFLAQHGEITDAALGYLPTPSPTTPSTVAANPRVLVPHHFGIQVF